MKILSYIPLLKRYYCCRVSRDIRLAYTKLIGHKTFGSWDELIGAQKASTILAIARGAVASNDNSTEVQDREGGYSISESLMITW